MTVKSTDQTRAERDALMDALSYKPETGEFHWKISRPGLYAGDLAGGISPQGYIRICVNQKSYKAHRLAWLFVHGEWPEFDVDHINQVKRDNRIANLRPATRSENMQNTTKARASNKSCGLLGVTWSKQKSRWVASIWLNKKRKHIGLFDDPEKAHAAYVSAKREMHPAGML